MVKTHRNQGCTSRASVPAKWEAIRKIKQIRKEKRTCQVGDYFPRISNFQAWHVTCHAKKGKHMNEKSEATWFLWHVTTQKNSEGVHASFQEIKGYRGVTLYEVIININLIVYINIYYTSKYTRTSSLPILLQKSSWHVTCHAHKSGIRTHQLGARLSSCCPFLIFLSEFVTCWISIY
jgi:hypothetical protein